ncbi:GDSL-type esterase/lipase family protein [Peristeroidobacter soli]|uniref:GDSL-type esterase/lipase family protein n=1 Tax=Peristeroidobacter soli TaxID=2497877 RepID=UPI00101D760D|nr:GDSL-type esterase/lipase family protein [Peristeroidobacter soli]
MFCTVPPPRVVFSALLCLFFSLVCTAQAPMNATASVDKHLVIIGASYAAEWENPKLPGYTVTNKGIGGQESSDLRARFERDVIELKPDTVMIWGHYNDVVRAQPQTMAAARKKAQDNYRAMVEQARAAGIVPILVTELTIPVPDTIKEKLLGLVAGVLGKNDYRAQKNTEIKALNVWLRDYAKAQKIQLVDLETALDSGNGTRKVEYTRSDNSHVSPAGYDAITKYVVSQLG